MKKYYSTIGLEIHAELKTQTKMFCSCKNNPDEEKPNVNICPVCMAHPGTLPVINRQAIENVIKVGLALGGRIADFTEFDRKNYFYPDIPKGYQISQYKYPIVEGGYLAHFDLTRIHLEEDTANNKHEKDFSLIDFNRAGIPLMELVTEPHTFENKEETARNASLFAKEFQLVLLYLGVSEANMDKGEMRVEVNISVSTDAKKFGTKVEVKNLNSFRSVERAILYEIDRMIELHEDGKGSEIVQETRGWDEGKQETFSQRTKESSQDYRYFPDPDLPKLYLHGKFSAKGGPASGWDLDKIKKDLPELPEAKRVRYKKDFGIKEEDIEVYVNDRELGEWFEEIYEALSNLSPKERNILGMHRGLIDGIPHSIDRVAEEWGVTIDDIKKIENKALAKLEHVKVVSNFITTDYLGLKKINPDIKFSKPENMAELINMFMDKKISSRAAKDILAINVVDKVNIGGESPLKIATEKNMLQSSDEGAIKKIVEKIISENPEVVAVYKGGKENAIMSLVGKVIKESKGSANPQIVIKLLKDLLK